MNKIKENFFWAIIPARSGSKGIKNKNIKKLFGKPLLAHTIIAAKKSNCFNKVIVLTDSKKYSKIAKKYGAEIPFLRPKNISKDDSTDNDLYCYFIKFLLKKNISAPKYLVHLSPTVPIRSNNVIKKGLEYFLKYKKGKKTMRSVSEMSQPSYKTMRIVNNKLCSILKKDFDLNKLNFPRQSYQKTYMPNGLVDILDTNFLIKNKKTHGKEVLPFVVNQVHVDIDTHLDFHYAKFLIKNKKFI